MKHIISILLICYASLSWGSDAQFSEDILNIDEVGVPFSPGTVQNVKLGLSKDGRWDLLQYTEGTRGVREIHFGVNGTFCPGLCSSTTLSITPKSLTLNKSAGTTDLSEPLPAINLIQYHDEKFWSSIEQLVDFAEFEALPDNIGCPGCADAPVFFIEIYYENRFKRVRFEEQDGSGDLYNRLKEILTDQEASLKLVIEKLGL